MCRVLLILSLCLRVMSIPVDKKQSPGLDDQSVKSQSNALTYERRQQPQVPNIDLGTLPAQLLAAFMISNLNGPIERQGQHHSAEQSAPPIGKQDDQAVK
ncbi:uncharacterized protein BX664DRAFT_352917 [Halteromyces radiatus]|uniref:uncharacterized protein n=1 Tax=Halteromyces radiatus TaxID=101107 RepID=UPI00221EB4FA|nr:uncharacterized protein BX664DRAFT_352917 [Halteromyces radiatus]KAI8079746.1 hypothetical protein BX664DRAFT_352917 [Halteromyces radiatus]